MAASGASRFLTRRQPASGLKAPTALPHLFTSSRNTRQQNRNSNWRNSMCMCGAMLPVFTGLRDDHLLPLRALNLWWLAWLGSHSSHEIEFKSFEMLGRSPVLSDIPYNLSSSLGPEFEKLILRFPHERNLSKELMSFSYYIFLSNFPPMHEDTYYSISFDIFFFIHSTRYSWRVLRRKINISTNLFSS